MAEMLSCVVDTQRSAEPPVTLRQAFFVVRIECGRVVGLGLSEYAGEAIDQMFSGRLVEA